MHLKGEKWSVGQHSKIRLTGLAAGNASDERLPMFVIEKANKPRFLKVLEIYRAVIVLNARVGRQRNFSKNA